MARDVATPRHGSLTQGLCSDLLDASWLSRWPCSRAIARHRHSQTCVGRRLARHRDLRWRPTRCAVANARPTPSTSPASPPLAGSRARVRASPVHRRCPKGRVSSGPGVDSRPARSGRSTIDPTWPRRSRCPLDLAAAPRPMGSACSRPRNAVNVSTRTGASPTPPSLDHRTRRRLRGSIAASRSPTTSNRGARTLTGRTRSRREHG